MEQTRLQRPNTIR